MHFDWYQATVKAGKADIIGALMSGLPGAYDVELREGGGGHKGGYKGLSFVKDRSGDPLAWILHDSPTASPNIRADTEAGMAPEVARVCREMWPDHRVTRLDVAEDMTAPGLYQTFSAYIDEVCEARGIRTVLEMAPRDIKRGSTLYAGSKASVLMLRLYEKGRQMVMKGKVKEEDADPNHVRLELQVRPQKQAKSAFAKVALADVWGASSWTKDIANRCFSLDVPRITLQARQQSHWDKVQNVVMDQYFRHWMEGGARLARDKHGLLNPNFQERMEVMRDRFDADMQLRYQNHLERVRHGLEDPF